MNSSHQQHRIVDPAYQVQQLLRLTLQPEMKSRIAEGLDDLRETVQTLKGVHLPELERETEHVSLARSGL
ncbi:MAG: hypothetical protein WBB23_23690 [Desulforhopalus sp.]